MCRQTTERDRLTALSIGSVQRPFGGHLRWGHSCRQPEHPSPGHRAASQEQSGGQNT